MFKHLLLPIDGSPMSDYAVEQGIALARATGAKVTGTHVMSSFHWLSLLLESIETSRDEFFLETFLETKRRADSLLSRLTRAAAQSEVASDACVVDHEHVYEGIIAVAESQHCDLIVMASHSRSGVRAVLLGSESHKVLTHSRVPVLVLHPPQK